jgi:membrane-bound lytic murein transglycosylase D
MHAEAAMHDARIEVALDSKHASIPLEGIARGVLLLFLAGLCVTLWPLAADARSTIRAIRAAHVLHRIGRVRLLISDTEHVPFAAWIPGHFFIVLPAALVLRPTHLRMALRHEAQHHRQRDTLHLYPTLVLRSLFGLNPWLFRQLFALQEFACDEALARRPGHCARSYCACLLEIAEAALACRTDGLRSFMAGNRAFTLARRVEAALQPPARPLRTSGATGVGIATAALLVACSVAIATPVEDRRLARADADRLVATAATSFPLAMNDAVLEQLNLLVATPDGRAFLRAGIERMREHQQYVVSELRRSGLPEELVAVPLVESGYRNLKANGNAGRGAGLWMFIGPTARAYGLEVTDQRDQRLEIEAETGAAIRLFSSLYQQFGDWPLALMAYNAGNAKVATGISELRSRDAWALYRGGYGNEPVYLARVMAVMLILAHPELMD